MWWKNVLFIFTIIIAYIFWVWYEYIGDVNVYDSVCFRLHVLNQNKNYKIIPLFTKEECKEIIRQGNNYAKKNKWCTTRHVAYHTTDNRITKKWKCHAKIKEKFKTIIRPLMAEMFHVDKKDIGISEFFIAKYDANKQNSLQKHKDGGEFSIIVALNDEFKGGGTSFTQLKQDVKLKVGECLVFSGQNEHCGIPITQGKRYILTGFFHYKSNGYCSCI